mmetsp:Transcript_67145/g.146049  ORF Transcript_67145/g.146049 Transcript_67145/m.146049 type:complete len:274 (+) Transcript_67145:31-852(+)
MGADAAGAEVGKRPADDAADADAEKAVEGRAEAELAGRLPLPPRDAGKPGLPLLDAAARLTAAAAAMTESGTLSGSFFFGGSWAARKRGFAGGSVAAPRVSSSSSPNCPAGVAPMLPEETLTALSRSSAAREAAVVIVWDFGWELEGSEVPMELASEERWDFPCFISRRMSSYILCTGLMSQLAGSTISEAPPNPESAAVLTKPQPSSSFIAAPVNSSHEIRRRSSWRTSSNRRAKLLSKASALGPGIPATKASTLILGRLADDKCLQPTVRP